MYFAQILNKTITYHIVLAMLCVFPDSFPILQVLCGGISFIFYYGLNSKKYIVDLKLLSNNFLCCLPCCGER